MLRQWLDYLVSVQFSMPSEEAARSDDGIVEQALGNGDTLEVPAQDYDRGSTVEFDKLKAACPPPYVPTTTTLLSVSSTTSVVSADETDAADG